MCPFVNSQKQKEKIPKTIILKPSVKYTKVFQRMVRDVEVRKHNVSKRPCLKQETGKLEVEIVKVQALNSGWR